MQGITQELVANAPLPVGGRYPHQSGTPAQARIKPKAAWAIIAAGLALVAAGIAVAMQHDARPAASPQTRQQARATVHAACEGCATFGFEVRIPADMLMADPIPTF
ncbi:MAG: hypothetical protein IPI73_29600 [Betaproteobacteria bacterium]|nr:hypothetical protein [Betaproteobacteria bacterium]